jgi:hypothetical protein
MLRWKREKGIFSPFLCGLIGLEEVVDVPNSPGLAWAHATEACHWREPISLKRSVLNCVLRCFHCAEYIVSIAAQDASPHDVHRGGLRHAFPAFNISSFEETKSATQRILLGYADSFASTIGDQEDNRCLMCHVL